MVSTSVIQRFASALADVVLGPNGMDSRKAVEDLRNFAALLKEFGVLPTIFASPAISPARKRNLVKKLSEMLGTSPLIRNFLLVLVDHRRAAALPQMVEAFESLLDERMGFARAEVTSATALTAEQERELAGQLAELAGRQVRMRFVVDPRLIGGATARLGSKVYDGSVRGHLEALRSRLSV